MGYAEGVNAGVFEHLATGQQFVLRDTIVESVRLNLESIARGFPGYQGKKSTAKVNPEQLEEDPHQLEAQSPTTKGDSLNTHEYNNEPLMEHEEVPTRRPRQLLVRFMYEWALTMRTEDELEPPTVAEASRSTHWKEAMEREYQSLVHNDMWELIPLPPNRTVVRGKW